MHEVHPGTTLGRYAIARRAQEPVIGDPSSGQRWVARDSDLERDVVLLVLPLDDPHTDAALDAARRASGVGHPGLTRILDVDHDDERAWVTESFRGDDRSLAELATHGLPAEEVRRITGEVALVLEAARSRGLHHLAISPDSVFVGPDGSVRVRGLAVDAALAGVDEEGDEAAALDGAGVVALAYAGLTGSWPLQTSTSLPPAPRDATGVLPPSHLAVGVPSDLDTICRETLADDAGPSSPGDYAASVSPWSRTPVDDGAAQPLDEAAADDGADAPFADAPGPDDTQVIGVTPAAGAAAQEHRSTAVDSDDDEPTQAISRGATAPSDEPTQVVSAEGSDEPGTARTGRGAAAGAAAVSVAGALAGGGKILGERVGRAAQRTRERAGEAAADRRAQREAIRSSESRDRVSLGSAGSQDDLEPPAPLLPADASEPPSREQSRVVVAIMALFVVVALVVGAVGVSKIGDNTDLSAIFGSDAQGADPVRPTQSSSTSRPSGGGNGARTSEPIPVIGAIGYDPNGDGAEHNSEAQRVYDDDLSTSWTTEGYESPNFGNKGGVGIVLDLGQARQVRSATLQLPQATTVQVFVGDEAGIAGTELGRSEGKNGSVTITGRSAARGQYVTIWFTTTVQSDDGRHRASLAEVVLR
ncbi:protein kinase family protein [Janibacter melonis]|uniref:hypothetical protein n=1 Tax=Janibacter melonis TaxID=262209 RepID=UPI00174DF10C|nr:hypothetical protein [Janibacter melonis]